MKLTVGDGTLIEVQVSEPTVPEAKKLIMEDVWGVQGPPDYHFIHTGLLVANSCAGQGLPTVCPIWGDTLPSKSVTVVCPEPLVSEVTYWLEYVHGAESVSRKKDLGNGNIALRSDYQCW